jgi:hypothetical protein
MFESGVKHHNNNPNQMNLFVTSLVHNLPSKIKICGAYFHGNKNVFSNKSGLILFSFSSVHFVESCVG